MPTERLLISLLLLRAKNGSNIFNHLVHNVAFVVFFEVAPVTVLALLPKTESHDTLVV